MKDNIQNSKFKFQHYFLLLYNSCRIKLGLNITIKNNIFLYRQDRRQNTEDRIGKIFRLRSPVFRLLYGRIFLYLLPFAWVCIFLFNINGAYGQSLNQEFSFYQSDDHKRVTISSLAEWEQQRWEIIKAMEAVMGPLPDRASLPPLDMRVKDTLKAGSYMRLTINFRAIKGERVSAYLYLPYRKGIGGQLPAMVALHPTGEAGKKIVDGKGRVNRGYAKELAERGYIVIAPDYPGFGELKDYNFKADRYQSGTMAGIFYHMRCVDLLSGREDVDEARIGVIGHSLGGHNAMFLGAFDHRLKVIVSSSGWTQLEYYDIGKVAHERYGGRLGPWAQERYMPLFRDKYNLKGEDIPFNFHEIIALLAPRAFFSNSPLNDSNFDVEGVKEGISESRMVYDFLNAEEKLQVKYPEAGHDFPTEVRREAYQFVDQKLDHVPNEHEIQ